MRRYRFGLLLLMWLPALLAGAAANERLPLDPDLRYGTLNNGLTYYIRHNETPKNRADFYIVQNVGSILEEEEQRGLAHFLEHMAFNGTEHFPGKAMLDYLETIGVKFGTNVNAYTAVDETVYNLSDVPVLRESTVDSALLILYDWASQISLEEQEIDNERGVIREEWRTRSGASMRQLEKLVPQIYAGSRYAHRLPIGRMEVIDHFTPETLRAYYKKWYRPDLQAIVVVGDIDAERVEAQVKELFGRIPLPEERAERIYYPVTDNETPIVATAFDKEATQADLMLFFKHDPLPREARQTTEALRNGYLQYVMASMLNARLQEIAQKANAPFLYAYGYDDDFILSKTKRAFTVGLSSKEGGEREAFAAVLRELERVNRYGFTPAEYERAKADYLRSAETAYNERKNQKNSYYVREYVANFTEGEAIPGLEKEYELAGEMAATPLQRVNNYAQSLIGRQNVVIALMGPEKEGRSYPSETELLTLFDDAQAETIAPYEESVSDAPLLGTLPAAGSVRKTTRDKRFGTTIWELSNGVKVIVKPTDFKADEILVTGSRKGGSLQLDEQDALSIKALNDLTGLGGVGAFSRTDLGKKLAGKRVSVDSSVGEQEESVGGSTSPRDLETFLQLLYLTLTDQRKDEDAFRAWQEQMRTALANRAANPRTALSDTLVSALYRNHPRKTNLQAADIDRISYDRVLELYRERFGNADGFVFTFVGNVDPDSLRPLAERYLGGLPSDRKRESKTAPIPVRTGNYRNHFERPMETPKSTVFTLFSGKCPYTLENRIRMSMLEQVMDIVYTETIREEEGGTYGVSASGQLFRDPDRFRFVITFGTNDRQEASLEARAIAELQKTAQEGPRRATFDKVREYMLKQVQDNRKKNEFWLGILNEYYAFGTDPYSRYEEILRKQTPESVARFARMLLKQENRIEVVMRGVSTPADGDTESQTERP